MAHRNASPSHSAPARPPARRTPLLHATHTLVDLPRAPSRHYKSYPPPGGLDNDIIAITEDRSGVLWVGTTGAGLGRFDQRTGRFKTYRHRASDPSSLSDDVVSRVFIDRSGTMWVATWNGLDRFDPASERFVIYKRDKESQTEQYYNFAEDQAGTLWLGSIWGLTRFDPSSGQFTVYSHKPNDPGSLSENLIDNVHIDHLGTVWAATQNGLNKLDIKSGSFTKYYAADGLPINDLSCILEDQSGNLWISTSRGLSKFDPLKKIFKNYSTADGLPGDDLTGWDACFKSPSGEMFFGGFSGGIGFYPEKIEDRPYIPPIVLTDFQLSGNPVKIGPQSLLKKSITYTNDLTLSHEQNVFSITFSALSYFDSATNRYRYKLEGLDHQWTEVGGDLRRATYTTLPAATYKFRVQGATSSGMWSEPGVELGITILPPWWDTLWFRLVTGALILASLGTLYRLRLRQLAHQFNMRMEASVAERTRIARDLHDTMLQSFQGVLLKFQAISYMVLDKPAEAQKTLEDVIDLASEAIAEGRDTVQGLRSSTLVGNDLAQAFSMRGTDLAANHGNQKAPDFRVKVLGTPRDLAPLLRDEIYRIGCEALRNAFRHAHAAQIEVEIRYDQRQLRLRIRDDGKGIDPSVLHEGGRDGHYGFPGMHERAKLVGGKLAVWSELNSGTEAELTIPAVVAYAKWRAERRSFFWRKSD